LRSVAARDNRVRPSFPTRRSSDLAPVGVAGAGERPEPAGAVFELVGAGAPARDLERYVAGVAIARLHYGQAGVALEELHLDLLFDPVRGSTGDDRGLALAVARIAKGAGAGTGEGEAVDGAIGQQQAVARLPGGGEFAAPCPARMQALVEDDRQFVVLGDGLAGVSRQAAACACRVPG